ncbi:MAG: RNA methyltransferase [Lachnospiraceae bacterium]|nr:RNA methyltransferase [Lachnospiraceae bacterium]
MIESKSNQQVKYVIQLQTKAKARREEKAFVVEGPRMVQETPAHLLRKVFVSEHPTEEVMQALSSLDASLVEQVADPVFKTMSETVTPQGVLAIVTKPEYAPESFFQGTNGLYLILENIQDPGNLGTMLRTAEGAGVDGVIMSKDTVDLFSPKVVRSTMGSLYRMPYLISEDLHATIDEMKQRGICVYAAHLKATEFYDELDYTKGTAFLIGNEGNGLRPETAALASAGLKIPMAGRVESLNAAMAAGILMYEASRQRRS